MLGFVEAAPVAVPVAVGFDLVATAVAITVAIFAGMVTLGAICWALDQLPQFPPFTQARNICNSMRDWLANSLGWLWQNANPITWIVDACTWAWQNVVWGPINMMENAINAFYRVRSVWIPAAVQPVADVLFALRERVDADEHKLTAEQQAFVWGSINIAQSADRAEWQQAAAGALHTAEAEIQHAIDLAALWVHDAEVEADVRADTVRADLQAEVTDIRNALGAAVSAIGGVARQLTTFETTTTQTQTQTQGDITGIVGTINQTLPAAIAGVAAQAQATEQKVATYLDECGNALCENLSDYGNGINALSSVFGLATWIALLGWMVADPRGFGGAVGGEVVPLVDGATGGTLAMAA